MPIRILICDDHEIWRGGLASIIRHQPDMELAGEADNGADAVQAFMALRPDLLLIDLRMPRMEGHEAIVRIREQAPDARILVLTTYDTDEDIYKSLKAGAKGYLLKDASAEEIIKAIRDVAGGRQVISANAAQLLFERIRQEDLTAREIEVLRELATGDTNRQIGLTLHIEERTVKTHISNIIGKLGATDRTEAVAIGLRRGLIRH